MSMHELITGNLDRRASWPGLKVVYSYLPPWEGCAEHEPNRVKVIFSGHDFVTVDHAGKPRSVSNQPGGHNVIGEEEPTHLIRVKEYSETLDLFPDTVFLCAEARRRGLDGFVIEPTLNRSGLSFLDRDAVLLGVAMRVRRALIGAEHLSDIEASTLASRVANRLIDRQNPQLAQRAFRRRLGQSAINRVCDFVEESLSCPITLDEMAGLCHLSTWHFSRDFKDLVGLSPWQYVLHRRIELAKRLLQETALPVIDVAWGVGYENISHFRRQFVKSVGVAPGEYRNLVGKGRTCTRPVSGSSTTTVAQQ